MFTFYICNMILPFKNMVTQMFLRKIRMFADITHADHYFEDSFTILRIIVHCSWFEDVSSHYLEK